MSKPIVAIVGRPNVGKSTLFNKIAGKRIAIVEDTPGVTRDRIYAHTEWVGNEFTIIDTGGIEPQSEDIIMTQMRNQAQVAIETSDVIIFIVDGKEGLTGSDMEIAQILRKSQKPIVLVVNKIDSLKDENNAYEFYNLGIGDPITISASQSLGLGDMLDGVISHFKEDTISSEEEEYIKVAIVGKPNVGKSSLINKIIGEDRVIVTDIPGTTRDAIDITLESEYGKFTLTDTAGLRRKSKIKKEIERYSVIRTISAIERSDICILILDASEDISEQDKKIIGYAHEINKGIMILVNKWDLIEKDNETLRKYENDIKNELFFIEYAPYLFISAKTGQRVNKVLEMAKECYDNCCKRISTGILNEVVGKAVMMKEPPIVGLKRLKIYYVTQIGVKPPTFIFFVNDPNALYFSYERYLENQLRSSFDFSGTGIKIKFRERKG